MPETRARIVIVQELALCAAALRALVEDHHDVVATVHACADAAAEVERIDPDLLLVDFGMLGCVADIKQARPGLPVLVLSSRNTSRRVQASFRVGADGFLPRAGGELDLVEAIGALRAGELYVHPSVGVRLVRAQEDPLTARERQIARLIALGHTNQEIARDVFVSVRTVESHRTNILTKLRLDSRASLVRWALEHEIIGDEYGVGT